MKVLYAGPMGYRRGDRVSCRGREWTIERMQQDARAFFPTKYTLRAGDLVIECERNQVEHAGPLIEIGRDGLIYETVSEWAARHRSL